MSQVYVGEFEYRIDDQRRVPLPKEWRDGPPPAFYLIPSGNRCVEALPEQEFLKNWLPRAEALSPEDSAGQRRLMNMARRAQRVTVDGQNRIKIDPKLMEHARLSSQAVLMGGLTRFYIASPENAQEVYADREVD